MSAVVNGGERDQLKNAKISVLKLINDNRDILFGKVSEALSRETKEAKWAEVANHAHVLGAFPNHRSWDYLKDTTWQNWRKRFVEKREKKEKYEKTGHGTKIVYDEADILINEILEALGRNGPSSNSQPSYSYSPSNTNFRDISDVLEIEIDAKNDEDEEAGEDNSLYQSNESVTINEVDDDTSNSNYSSNNMNLDTNMGNGDFVGNGFHHEEVDLQEYFVNGANGLSSSMEQKPSLHSSSQPKIVSTSSLSCRTAILRKYAAPGFQNQNRSVGQGFSRKRPFNFLNSDSTTPTPGRTIERELMELKCKKIRAELGLLERESYKKDLEILKLERSLGIPASHITRKFYNRANNNALNRGTTNGRLNR